MAQGIDYGLGLTNIDHTTEIRYGVIHQNEVLQAWADSAESDYGDPTCPDCGNRALASDDLDEEYTEAKWFTGKDFACTACQTCFWSDNAYGDSPLAFTLDDGEYVAEQSGDDCDIFIIRSPYYTYAPFCSPCAPGAGYLGSAEGRTADDDVKTYCFGHDWFDGGKAPYAVYRVDTNELVAPLTDTDTE